MTSLAAYARSVVEATTLEGKLAAPPADLHDDDRSPGAPIAAPGRPANLQIRPAAQAKVPKLAGMPDKAQRIRILHGAANHELQAVELFAWAIVQFPDTPTSMRKGLLHLIREEQRHLQLFIDRISELGGQFGDCPVSGYFWNKVPLFTTPLHFICALNLTFEGVNLDHAPNYAEAARACGDPKTAELFDVIERDEIRHVHFGWHWLEKLKDPEQSMWDAYCAHLEHPVRPALARGPIFNQMAREKAGLSADFVDALKGLDPSRRV